MGTSSNKRSPETANWKLFRAVVGAANVKPERQSEELWRAAQGDDAKRLITGFQSETIAAAAQIAGEVTDPSDGMRRFEQLVVERHEAGVSVDLAKRALGRAIITSKGSVGFVGELFAEAAAYYAARDLPSYVGATGRVATTTEAISLKANLQDIARTTAVSVGEPPKRTKDWKNHIDTVIDRLRRSR